MFYPNLSVRLGPNDLIGDMYSFSRCDYLIGPQILLLRSS
jgi:hypothetical protein